MQQHHRVSKNPLLLAILLLCGAGIFSSCSSDDNPASEPAATPVGWHDGVMPGRFTVNANTYTEAEWAQMESAGAVFQPAAGYREGTQVFSVGRVIDYWLATQNGQTAGGVSGSSKHLHPHSYGYLYYGDCVRLVKDTKQTEE